MDTGTSHYLINQQTLLRKNFTESWASKKLTNGKETLVARLKLPETGG